MSSDPPFSLECLLWRPFSGAPFLVGHGGQKFPEKFSFTTTFFCRPLFQIGATTSNPPLLLLRRDTTRANPTPPRLAPNDRALFQGHRKYPPHGLPTFGSLLTYADPLSPWTQAGGMLLGIDRLLSLYASLNFGLTSLKSPPRARCEAPPYGLDLSRGIIPLWNIFPFRPLTTLLFFSTVSAGPHRFRGSEVGG